MVKERGNTYDSFYMCFKTRDTDLWCSKSEQWLPVGLTENRYEGTFCGSGDVWDLDKSVGYTSILNFQN